MKDQNSKGEGEILLEQIQTVAKEILHKFADICEIEGFRYYLAYGTLLGAIRHKDIIPWDDDIDVMMPRPDYERLIEYFKNNEKDLYPLKIVNDDTVDSYPYLITRISDSRFFLKVTNEIEYEIGIFIDIYPLDGLGNDYDAAKKIIHKTKRLSSLVFLSTRKYFHKGNTKSIIKLIIKFPAFLYAKIRGKNVFTNKIYSIVRSCDDYLHSKYVGCLVWPTYNTKEVFEKKLFDEVIEVSFNNYKYIIPKDYNTLLKQIYGDYMQLPDENRRRAHHLYKAYRIIEK